MKAYGLVQKTYNPNRMLTPMKRTNPKKGRDEDPGFVPIILGRGVRPRRRASSTRSRADGLTDESGYPRLAVSLGGAGTPQSYMGTFPAFLAAWGPVDMGFGSGQGVKCYHSEHLYGEFWHRAFTVSPDTPLCDYLISCGANVEASGGVVGVWRHANARIRGMKRVQVEPHLSVTGACSAEWVPIKPKTDAAFLYALVHVLLHEFPRERLDVAFLARAHGIAVSRRPARLLPARPRRRKKPLVWDSARGAAVAVRRARHRGGARRPLRRPTPSRSAPTTTCSPTAGSTAKPRSPSSSRTWRRIRRSGRRRSATCRRRRSAGSRASSSTTRTSARRSRSKAMRLPYRPVAVSLGKTVNNGWGGFECVLGAHDARGARRRRSKCPAGRWARRCGSIARCRRASTACCRGPTASWTTRSIRPTRRTGRRTRTSATPTGRWCRSPANGPWSQALGPTHFSWMFLDETPKGLPRVTLPDVWFVYRTNPAISFWDTTALGEKMARFPFMVAFAYTRDETNHYADVLLPEATDLESLQLIRIGGSKFVEQFWEQQGFALRQPAVATQRRRARLHGDRDRARAPHRTPRQIQRRDQQGRRRRAAQGRALGLRARRRTSRTPPEAIWDAVCRAASAELTDGTRSARSRLVEGARPRHQAVPAHQVVSVPDAGREAACASSCRTRSACSASAPSSAAGCTSTTCTGGTSSSPNTRRCRRGRISARRGSPPLVKAGGKPQDYPFWLLTARSMQYAWGANVGMQLIKEVADNIAGHRGVIINTEPRARLGIARRRAGGDRDAAAPGPRARRAAPGHPSRHAAADRPVRPLGDAVHQGFRHAEHELARVDVARPHRRDGLRRRHRAREASANERTRENLP